MQLGSEHQELAHGHFWNPLSPLRVRVHGRGLASFLSAGRVAPGAEHMAVSSSHVFYLRPPLPEKGPLRSVKPRKGHRLLPAPINCARG